MNSHLVEMAVTQANDNREPGALDRMMIVRQDRTDEVATGRQVSLPPPKAASPSVLPYNHYSHYSAQWPLHQA